jgi:hypothetical protein
MAVALGWVLAGPALAGGPLAATPQAATGVYSLALSAEEASARLDAAVEEVLAEFNFLIRPFAQRPLSRAATYCHDMSTALDATSWEVTCLEHAPDPIVLPLDGSPVVYERQSVPITAQVISREPLVVAYTTPEGRRTTTYRFHEEGLDLDFEVSSPRLPRPLVWTLPYVRKPVASVP